MKSSGCSKKNLLITGLPGVGKTTLIQKLCDSLAHLRTVGFYTTEIREGGIRKGFELIDLEGNKGILAHIDVKSLRRVGKYKVNVKGFEDFLETIPFFEPQTQLILTDEIGKMECFSEKFRRIVVDILDSEKPVVATIALKGSGLIAAIKERKDVRLFELTLSNRDRLLKEISDFASQNLTSV